MTGGCRTTPILTTGRQIGSDAAPPRLNVREHGGGDAVSGHDGAERGQDDGAGDRPVHGAAQQVAGVVVESVQDFHVAPVGELPVGEVGLP